MKKYILIAIAATVLLASCASKNALTVPADRQSCLWADCLLDSIPGAVTTINPEFGPEEFSISRIKGKLHITGGSQVGNSAAK